MLTDFSTSLASVVSARVSTAAEARIGMGPWRREAEVAAIEEADLRPEEATESEDGDAAEAWVGKEERERTA